MSIFSRRKRLLNPRRLGGTTASSRNRLSRILRRNRAGAPAMPKMSSRRQFHRALRRHPAWPAVMEQAAARARAQEGIRRERSGITAMGQASNRTRLRRIFLRNRTGLRRFALPVVSSVKDLLPSTAAATWRRSKLRRSIRRNRVLVVTLLAVSGLVAMLTGISMAQGEWNAAGFLGSDVLNAPPARFGAATTYDETTQEVVLFGGFVGSTSAPGTGVVSGPPILTDRTTYAYKTSAPQPRWERRDSIHFPSPRGYAAMAYDGAHKNVVLFGGASYRSNAVSGETWIWDGDEKDWTLQNPPEPRPDPRQNAVMVYDAHRRKVMMFGGRDKDGKPMNDTWIWNGSKWTIMPPDGAPSPRHSAAIAYDECRAEAVMFGGIGDPINNFAPQPGETWTWNGEKWTTPNPSPLLAPPRRIGASMAYSARSGRVLLYGGLYATENGSPTAAADTDIWRWDGDSATGWERMNTEAGLISNAVLVSALGDGRARLTPPPRAYASFAGIGGSVYLYGGTPAGEVKTGLPLDNILLSVPQVAFGDFFQFWEQGLVDAEGVKDTPLTRRCADPVPIPPDAPSGGQIDPEEAPKLGAREGMREIGQLPVLIGTDWPQANRNTHLSSPTRPNPNYTPAPGCPNRSTSGAVAHVENGENTHLFTDPKRNRIYQFFICDESRGLNENFQNTRPVRNLLIAVYDGTTLKMLGSVILPSVGGQPSFGLSFLGDRLMHDADRGRFLIRSYDVKFQPNAKDVFELVFVQQDLIEKGVDPVVKRIDLAGTPVAGNSSSRDAFFIHPKTGRYKFLFSLPAGGPTPGPPPAQNTPPKLVQWDIENGREDWRVELTGCSSTASPTAMRSGDRVYTTCVSNSRVAVVRIPVVPDPSAPAGERANPPEPPFPGPPSVVGAWGDPQAERMVLEVGQGAAAVWVFDGKTSRFVGRAGITSNPYSIRLFGFDPETGRLYAQFPDQNTFIAGERYLDEGGVAVLDTRLTPVSQALQFPQFVGFPAARLASLPSGPGVPRRIFMRRNGGRMQKYPKWETVNMPNEMFYTVLADEVPLPGQTDIAQLDALTIPVAEKPGKTEVSFDAEGSGYGIRLRSVGGIWSVLRPFAQAYPGTGEAVESLLLGPSSRPAVPGCVFPDRELMAGWVPQAHLSDQDAAARSLGLDVDSNSKTDLEGPFSRCNPTANASNLPPTAKPVFDVLWPLWQLVQLQGNNAAGAGTVETGKDAEGDATSVGGTPTSTVTPLGTLVRGEDKDGVPTARFDASTSLAWDRHFKEVECVGDALATNQATVGNIYGSANCVQKQGLVEATARGSASGAGPLAEEASKQGFSVGEGYSTVTVAKELVRGVVVTSTAVAKGIQLPGITIGYVKTEAVAWSNGRPGTERAKFTRTICRVQIPLFEQQQPYKDNACLNETQQKDLVKNWNDRWGVNSKMILPAYDPELYKGSPGGYIAGVIKPVADEIEDQLFAKDYQREVPGLVVEFYKDSSTQGPGRQTLQLAAVRAVAGLGVQCNADKDLVYSASAKDCVALAFDDDLVTEEFEEEFSEEEAELEEADGFWEPVEADLPGPLALGKRIGRFIQNLPLIRQLPIRAIGEALLAFPVWLLLGLPLLLASRRFALNQAQKGS